VVIRFNFAGSASLVEQVVSGAPVDVLATASRETMAKAVRARAVGTPVVFARNSMTIAVPPGNPGRISGVGDLGRPGVVLAVCDPAVPCGAAAAEVFRRNGVLTSPVTRELDVRAVLGKVMADEVDAGVVYVTDVRAAGARVESVPIPAATNAMTAYPVAVAAESGNQAAAKAFAAFVASSASARGVLRAYGFSGP
jgi:molybdate transport system substrate-binding protein